MNLSPEFSLANDAGGSMVLIDSQGVHHAKVRPVRLFPFTDSAAWISILSAEGKELGIVDHLENLPGPQRQVLQEALADRDFVPVIRSIEKVSRAATGYQWSVTTDRGATVFITEGDESIQQVGDCRLVVVDQRNTRYLIPDVNALDLKSRQRLERYY